METTPVNIYWYKGHSLTCGLSSDWNAEDYYVYGRLPEYDNLVIVAFRDIYGNLRLYKIAPEEKQLQERMPQLFYVVHIPKLWAEEKIVQHIHKDQYTDIKAPKELLRYLDPIKYHPKTLIWNHTVREAIETWA